MPQLFGRNWQRKELLDHVGDITQLAGVRLFDFSDGPERGVRAADFYCLEGLDFTVLLDRGMDIGSVKYKGIPIAWISGTGPVAPAFYDPRGSNWLRTFHGGLLTTCGLTQAGAASMDKGEELGLHGRISHIPARNISTGGYWDGDNYTNWISGEMREVSVFGYNLRLTRCISSKLGESRLIIQDQVKNCGNKPAPHMILYHFNLGFPLLSPCSKLETNFETVEPFNQAAIAGFTEYSSFSGPIPNYSEQVFIYKLMSDDQGIAQVRLNNPELGLSFQLRFRQQELPQLVQWKLFGLGEYVLGIEPTNCSPVGRGVARENGTLVELEPGEIRDYWLEATVLSEPMT
jgi:hypothetical protein